MLRIFSLKWRDLLARFSMPEVHTLEPRPLWAVSTSSNVRKAPPSARNLPSSPVGASPPKADRTAELEAALGALMTKLTEVDEVVVAERQKRLELELRLENAELELAETKVCRVLLGTGLQPSRA